METGEPECLHQLVPLVEGELRRIARRFMRFESPGHTLQTTALVNEAYLRLVDESQVAWQDRTRFFAIAARLMRPHPARSRTRVASRQARRRRIHLPLDEGLGVLAREVRRPDRVGRGAHPAGGDATPRKVEVVELRYFGGMGVEETAEAVHIHPNTVIRDWAFAKVWLKRELTRTGDDAD